MQLWSIIVAYERMLLPCVVPYVLAFKHTTSEHQAVRGENLWPASQEENFSLRTLWSATKQAQIKTCRQIFDKLSWNSRSTLRFLVSLLSEKKMGSVPLIGWHLYDPEFFTNKELMVRLFPDAESLLPSWYHRNLHPYETFMWQRNETASPVCNRSSAGNWLSWGLGFVSEEFTRITLH